MTLSHSDVPAYLVLARIEAAGVTARLMPDGTIQLRPAARVPPELVEVARHRKAELTELLRLRLTDPVRGLDRERTQ